MYFQCIVSSRWKIYTLSAVEEYIRAIWIQPVTAEEKEQKTDRKIAIMEEEGQKEEEGMDNKYTNNNINKQEMTEKEKEEAEEKRLNIKEFAEVDWEMWKDALIKDGEYKFFLAYLKGGADTKAVPEELRRKYQNWEGHYMVYDGLLYHKNMIHGGTINALVVPFKFRQPRE
jgi:hypothetical protein